MENSAGSESDARYAAPGERTLSWLDEDAPELAGSPPMTPAEPPDPPPEPTPPRRDPTRRLGIAFRRTSPRRPPRQRTSPEDARPERRPPPAEVEPAPPEIEEVEQARTADWLAELRSPPAPYARLAEPPRMAPPETGPYRPPAEPYTPPAEPYTPPAEPYAPPAEPYRPPAETYGRDAEPYGPEAEPYGPEGEPYAPQPQAYALPLDPPDVELLEGYQVRRPGKRRRLLFAVGVLAAVALVAAAATVLYPQAFRRFTADTTTTATADPGDVVSAPILGRTEAEFEMVSGAATVNITAADLGGDLYRISTPEGSSSAPRPFHKGDAIELQLTSSGLDGPSVVDIRLTSRLPWRLRLTGGATTHRVNLGAGGLLGLDVVAGATRVDLTLPRPKGTVPLKLTGGVKELLVHAPPNVPTRVRVGDGATTVRLDRFTRTRPEPGTVFTPDGWEARDDRYDLNAEAGVGTLRLDRVQ